MKKEGQKSLRQKRQGNTAKPTAAAEGKDSRNSIGEGKQTETWRTSGDEERPYK